MKSLSGGERLPVASKSTFERTRALEEPAYQNAMRFGNRIFEHSPTGITVVEALGVQAVAAAAYQEEGRARRSYLLARHDYGLRVVTHRLFVGADCRSSHCFSVDLLEGVTEIERHDGKDLTMTSRLWLQNQAFDAIELAAGTGRDTEHNPFLSRVALQELRLLSEHHEDDLLAEIVEYAEEVA